MITLEGKSVFGGVAIGKIQFYKRNEITIKRTRVEDVEAEVERFQNAKAKTLELLKGLYEKALEDVGEANAMIFEAHQLYKVFLSILRSRAARVLFPRAFFRAASIPSFSLLG